MSDCLQLDLDPFLSAFMRMASTSKKELPVLWRNEAKICFGGTAKMPGVADVTPPYAGGTLRDTREAEKHAKSMIAADIFSMYGTPSDAYALIDRESHKEANHFWYLHEHGMQKQASDVLQDVTGSILYPFDGGSFHRKMRNAGRRQGKQFKFFVTDPEELLSYVKTIQGRVWWLASGWREPLEALGARLPAGVKRHADAPGHLPIPIINDRELTIAVANDVKYATRIADMKRRIETVMNVYRVQRLDRMWEEYLAMLERNSGFKRI